MPVSSLRDVSQLTNKQPIQLGATDEPCVVLFGLSDIDKEKSWRTIKIAPNDGDLKVLSAFDQAHDGLHDIVKEHDGIKYISVKVNDTRTKAFDAAKGKAKIADVLTQGALLKVVIRANAWSMKDQRGISLQAALVQAVDDDINVDDLC